MATSSNSSSSIDRPILPPLHTLNLPQLHISRSGRQGASNEEHDRHDYYHVCPPSVTDSIFFSLCLHLLTICLSHRLLRLIHRNGCAPAELLRRQLHLLSRFLPPERFRPRTTKFPHCIATRLLRTPHSASALASYSSRPRSIEPTQ